MARNLHITNGDSAADIIQSIMPSDDVLPWRDPMHHGPFPFLQSLDTLSRIRLDYLTGQVNDLTPEKLDALDALSDTHDFTERDRMLAKSADYAEVVLWFEHDVLDQLQILQLLAWYKGQQPKTYNVSIICINKFAGVDSFRGIGQLSAEQMISLYPSRKPVNLKMLTSAASFWQAFVQSDPTTLLALCDADKPDQSELPFCRVALMRYCQEFPWTSDGLTRTERQLLTLVTSGVVNPTQVFLENMDMETCLYIGDWRTYTQLSQLCSGDSSLLMCKSGQAFEHPQNSAISAEDFRAQELTLTEHGKSVLKGDANARDSLVRSEWLGGVYLDSKRAMYCWNDREQAFDLVLP